MQPCPAQTSSGPLHSSMSEERSANRERSTRQLQRISSPFVFCFFLHTNAAGAVIVKVVPSTAVDRISLASVGAHVVDAHLPSGAWITMDDAFIDV